MSIDELCKLPLVDLIDQELSLKDSDFWLVLGIICAKCEQAHKKKFTELWLTAYETPADYEKALQLLRELRKEIQDGHQQI